MTGPPDPLPPLRDVITRHRLRARKSLGQNFLLDLNLTRRIARAGNAKAHRVIEIGPGPGGLTRALLMEGAEKVIAIERDRRCLPALDEIASAFPGRLEVIEGDALTIDISRWGPARIIANLPYNIATPLLIAWLKAEPWPPFYDQMTLMFQREVADRLTARTNTKAYGRLSVIAQYRCSVEKLFDVDRRAFTPPPKVTSTIVRFTPKPPDNNTCSVEALETLTAAAFGQRRKMLRTSLKSLSPAPKTLLEKAGIAPTLRAEDLTIDDFVTLARLHQQSSQTGQLP